MPLQKSVYKVKGKMDGMSYFFSKNGGYQFRKINPNMSDLVKTDPRFALTREYGFAFGLGANFAGALLKTVSSRWRYLMRGNTHAILTKKYNDYFKCAQGLYDGTVQHISVFYDVMRRDYNQLNKTNIPAWLVNFFTTQTEEVISNHQLTINTPLQLQQTEIDELKLKGADSVRIALYTLRVLLKTEISSERNVVYYEGSISTRPIIQQVTSLNGAAPLTILQAGTPQLDGEIESSIEDCGGIFVLFEPLKLIGGTYITLQRLCNGYWYKPETDQ